MGKMVEVGKLDDGTYGFALVSPAGELVKLHDFIFGPQMAVKSSAGLTSSTSYTNLDDGAGPTLTGVAIGELGRAIVTLTAYIEPEPGNQAFMGVEIRNTDTNALVRSPVDLDSLSLGGGDAIQLIGPVGRSSVEIFVEGLPKGRYTFTAKYRALSGGTHLFANRVVKVQPY
ncbi:hypothetical protein ABZ647_17715 [Micromonospora aurantiaca]|uniref:hypothetical protein n=1 Tax=Micromonospora aurantiaca (nom. illeg.) TaxID=47850 RepID=UPI0033F26FCC